MDKIKIMFVCHGNICRSPMAEYIMKKIVSDNGLSDRFIIDSAATSLEEIGNDIYPLAKRTLSSHNVPFSRHSARQVAKNGYYIYDYFLVMDRSNMRDILEIMDGDSEHKIYYLASFAFNKLEISDPWYSRNFEEAYSDIYQSCKKLLAKVIHNHRLIE